MIKTIEIKISNGITNTLNVIIIPSKKICYYNEKKMNITDEFTNELLHIIYLWKNEYGEGKGIDSEEFTITIITEEGKESFHGKGVYPNNYEALISLLGELNG